MFHPLFKPIKIFCNVIIIIIIIMLSKHCNAAVFALYCVQQCVKCRGDNYSPNKRLVTV